jgi:N-acetylneuraminate synthase
MPSMKIGETIVGAGNPVYIVAEVGINHNGDLGIAKKLIDAAVEAGCDAVKFQKRSPEDCVPKEQKSILRKTPWGDMSYIDYRHRVEFDVSQYKEIDRYCAEKKISWFASCWDIESVNFMTPFAPPCYKVASACIIDEPLLQRIRQQRRPIVLSTGMSTMAQVRRAVELLGKDKLLIVHTTSSYRFNPDEVNLKVIDTLRRDFDCPVGYSGHEEGYACSLAAVAMGAVFVERHITLDRTMWGSDQNISLEPQQLKQMVADIRTIERAMGDGVKRVYESEQAVLSKLRRCSVA